MAADVLMPRLDDSMEEGTILRWLLTDGDVVARGDELVEIETDKSTVIYGAEGEGVLQVVAAAGETLPVGALIARLGAGSAAVPPLPPPAPPAAPAAPRAPGAKGEISTVEPSRAHGAVARRMAESRATIPDFTAGVAVAAPGLPAVIAACGIALRELPRVNGAYRDGRFELHARVNVGVVVATEDALVVPTIFDADTKAAAQIADELAMLTERAEAGTLTAPEVAGATFTVAAADIDRFTQIIAPGHAAALAVGRAELTLSADHRILFPADAVRFLRRVAELVSA